MSTLRAQKPHFLKLYLISLLLVVFAHFVISMAISHYFLSYRHQTSQLTQENPNKHQEEQLKIRLLGYKNAQSKTGDLQQLQVPDQITRNESLPPKKSLQVNKELRNNQNVARIIPDKKAPSPPQKLMSSKKQAASPRQLKKFSLADLGKINKYQPLPEKQKTKEKDSKQEDKGEKKVSQNNITYQTTRIEQYIEQVRIFESLSGKLANLNLRNVSSSVQIEIPKGNIKEDELNSVERRFYSFKRRVFQAYVQSLLTQAYSQQSSRLPFPFTDRSLSISAKVTYDENGDLVRIKMLNRSKNNKLQQVFISALQDIQTIPNPPKEIINGFGEFSQVYVLNITF